MEKPSVSLLNAVNNAPFPTASDLHDDFVLAEPGQTFKVFVSLKRPSSITWPEGSTHLHVAGRLDGEFHMHSKFISRQNLAAFLAHAEDSPDEVQVILGAEYRVLRAPQALFQQGSSSAPANGSNILDQPSRPCRR